MKPVDRGLDATPPPAANGIDRREALLRLARGTALAALGAPALKAEAAYPAARRPTVAPTAPERGSAGCAADPRSDLTLPAEDPLNDIKALFDISFSFIPVFGGAIGMLFDLFFPQSSVNLWQRLSEQINNLITERLQQSDLDKMQIWLTGSDAPGATPGGITAALANFLGLQQVYKSNPDPQIKESLIASANSLHQSFTTNIGFFQPGGYEDRSLPLFAQFANLHLLFLRDVATNGDKFGFDPALIGVFKAYLSGGAAAVAGVPGRIKAYCDYIDATLPKATARLQKHYSDNQRTYQDWGAPNGQTGYIVTGAWQAKKEQNDALSLLQYAVSDYRTLWPTMMEAGGGHANLTREIWFGPYGKPDMADIGLDPLDVGGGNRGPVADVPAPNVPPAAPLTYINIPYLDAPYYGDADWSTGNGSRYWQFPTDMPGNWGGGSNGDWWGLNLDPGNGGSPVVGIKVDVSRYISRATWPLSTVPCSPGHLISALWFTQKNGVQTVSPGHDTPGAEIKQIWSDTVPVPQGHVLASATIASRVQQMYANINGDGASSIGSIVFGFRLGDPTLKLPSPSLLRAYYVGALESLSLGDLAQVAAQWHSAAGHPLSERELGAIAAELQRQADRFQWDVDRASLRALLGAARG